MTLASFLDRLILSLWLKSGVGLTLLPKVCLNLGLKIILDGGTNEGKTILWETPSKTLFVHVSLINFGSLLFCKLFAFVSFEKNLQQLSVLGGSIFPLPLSIT